MIAEELYLRAKTEKMRKKQEQSPVERRGRRSAFADVVLSDANTNDAGKSGSIELLYPNGVRILLLVVKFWTRRKSPYLSQTRPMYSSEDLERFYVEYQSEWEPRGMTMRAFCDRNNVPYRAMDNFVRNIREKIVEVEVTGRPEEGEPEAPAATTSSGRDIKVREAPVTERPARPAGRISVRIRFGDGTEVSRRGLDYVGLKVLIEKLEVPC